MRLLSLAATLAAAASLACAAGLSRYSSEVQARYQLTPEDLSHIQFYVGVLDVDPNPATDLRELALRYRASDVARQTNETVLSQRTVVTQKDFVIRDQLPGVYVNDGKTDSLTIEVGTDTRLTFSPAANGVYALAAINGAPYRAGERVTIRGTQYTVQERPTVVLMFNEKNSREIMRERINAEGRRVH